MSLDAIAMDNVDENTCDSLDDINFGKFNVNINLIFSLLKCDKFGGEMNFNEIIISHRPLCKRKIVICELLSFHENAKLRSNNQITLFTENYTDQKNLFVS